MSDTRSVTLWARDSLNVGAEVLPDGSLVITGQDLRADHLFGPGSGEYEYALTILPEDVRRVILALGGEDGDDVLALLAAHGDDVVSAGEMSWLRGIGVEPQFWSHIGG